MTTKADSKGSPTSHEELQRRIASWARTAIEAAGLTPTQIDRRLQQPAGWLARHLRAEATSTLTPDQVRQLAGLLRVRVPRPVVSAMYRLPSWVPERLQRVDAQPTRGRLAECVSVEDEVRCLLTVGAAIVPQATRQRELAATLARFGLGELSIDLQELGRRLGVKSSRARQIEERVIEGAQRASVGMPLPHLSALARAVETSRGLSVAAVAAREAGRLGAIALEEALRFLDRIRPERDGVPRERVLLAGNRSVSIIGTTSEEGAWLKPADAAARRLSLAYGAVSLDSLAEEIGFDGTRAQLVSCVDALPDRQWLDEGRRWLAFPCDSWLSRRVEIILTIAARPLPLASLHAGLVREARRPRTPGQPTTPHLPPLEILAAWLATLPGIRFCADDAVTLRRRPELAAVLSPAQAEVVADIEARGGVISYAALKRAIRERGTLTEHSLHFLSSYVGYLEAIEKGVWKLRGRTVTRAALAAARG